MAFLRGFVQTEPRFSPKTCTKMKTMPKHFKKCLTNHPPVSILIMLRLESWLSGLRRTTGNRVWANTPPRVQIPNSPPRLPCSNTVNPRQSRRRVVTSAVFLTPDANHIPMRGELQAPFLCWAKIGPYRPLSGLGLCLTHEQGQKAKIRPPQAQKRACKTGGVSPARCLKDVHHGTVSVLDTVYRTRASRSIPVRPVMPGRFFGGAGGGQHCNAPVVLLI